MNLRPYQREAIDGLYSWFANNEGNPLLVLPTAAGKSVIQATFVHEAIRNWPKTRILLVSHVKELLQQNVNKLLAVWPQAPVGLYSAGLGRRDVGHQITVAGIQSIHKRVAELGMFDLIMVDECHLIPPSGDGMYRRFMEAERKANNAVKVIGMTATHYRMKTGLLHEGDDALFDGIAYEVSVRRLIDEGYLCNLISKNGLTRPDLSGVGTRGGEFIQHDLGAAMDKEALTKAAIDECMKLCADRKSWLVFCTGVAHAHHVAEEIRSRGLPCGVVTGDTDPQQREWLLEEFKAGRTHLTNCDVLTTGFDAPNLDALIMLRPTKSTGLYVQMVGRAMRTHPGKLNSLILDFSGNIERHGPIDEIKVKSKRKAGESAVSGAPVKECPQCQSVVPISVMQCPDCGYLWPVKQAHEASASFADILSKRFEPPVTVDVDSVTYSLHPAKPGSYDTVCVTYMCGLRRLREFICFSHHGFARQKAEWWFSSVAPRDFMMPGNTQQFLEWIEGGMKLREPIKLRININGKYDEIIGHEFPESQPERTTA